MQHFPTHRYTGIYPVSPGYTHAHRHTHRNRIHTQAQTQLPLETYTQMLINRVVTHKDNRLYVHRYTHTSHTHEATFTHMLQVILT